MKGVKGEMPNQPNINAPEKRSTAGILTLERARAEMERSAISCMRKVKGKGKVKDGVQATFAFGAAVIAAHLSGVARFLACEDGV